VALSGVYNAPMDGEQTVTIYHYRVKSVDGPAFEPGGDLEGVKPGDEVGLTVPPRRDETYTLGDSSFVGKFLVEAEVMGSMAAQMKEFVDIE
jgi:hypothetical protein